MAKISKAAKRMSIKAADLIITPKGEKPPKKQQVRK